MKESYFLWLNICRGYIIIWAILVAYFFGRLLCHLAAMLPFKSIEMRINCKHCPFLPLLWSLNRSIPAFIHPCFFCFLCFFVNWSPFCEKRWHTCCPRSLRRLHLLQYLILPVYFKWVSTKCCNPRLKPIQRSRDRQLQPVKKFIGRLKTITNIVLFQNLTKLSLLNRFSLYFLLFCLF